MLLGTDRASVAAVSDPAKPVIQKMLIGNDTHFGLNCSVARIVARAVATVTIKTVLLAWSGNPSGQLMFSGVLPKFLSVTRSATLMRRARPHITYNQAHATFASIAIAVFATYIQSLSEMKLLVPQATIAPISEQRIKPSTKAKASILPMAPHLGISFSRTATVSCGLEVIFGNGRGFRLVLFLRLPFFWRVFFAITHTSTLAPALPCAGDACSRDARATSGPHNGAYSQSPEPSSALYRGSSPASRHPSAGASGSRHPH